MTALGDPAQHFWITRSVARCMGISFTEAMAAGDLSAADYAGIVTACRACDHVAECQAWLATQSAKTATPPEFCPNRRVLTELTH